MPKYLLLIVESEADVRGGRRGRVQRRDGGAHRVHQGARRARRHDPRRRGAAARGDGDVPARHALGRASTVVDNPAPDLKEILGGYYLIEAADDDTARRIAERCPAGTATSRCDRSGRSPARVCRLTPRSGVAAAEAQRRYWGRVLAATLRMARDVDVAEEATADAFLLALQTWPERGVPDSVEAWLLTAARRRAIDRIRRLVRLRERLAMLAVAGRRGRRRRPTPSSRRRRCSTTSCASSCCAATRRSPPRRRSR